MTRPDPRAVAGLGEDDETEAVRGWQARYGAELAPSSEQPAQGVHTPSPEAYSFATPPRPPAASPASPVEAPVAADVPPVATVRTRRRPSRWVVLTGGLVLGVALSLVVALLVVPLLHQGPTIPATSVSAVFTPDLDGVSSSTAVTSTDPGVLFTDASTTATCAAGMRTALSKATTARVVVDATTRGRSQFGYVAVFSSPSAARSAAAAVDKHLLECSEFFGGRSHLSSSPGYREYGGDLMSGNVRYTSTQLVQYGNVVVVTFATGTVDVLQRATVVAARVDSLH